VSEFDIREYRARMGLPARVENSDVIKSVTKLLVRDLSEHLAASGAQSQSSRDRTVRRNADDGARGESASA
jgi:hypothetical protein